VAFSICSSKGETEVNQPAMATVLTCCRCFYQPELRRRYGSIRWYINAEEGSAMVGVAWEG
jgi:hypothetical protein